MPELQIQQEFEAIKTITGVLESLNASAQQRVLRFAMEHLGLGADLRGQEQEGGGGAEVQEGAEQENHEAKEKQIVDIRTFKNEKDPQSDVQMAALVAYYLAELAPEERRKDAISKSDVIEYFKQAGYPLPEAPKDTLPHAKSAGYFDKAGHGRYKLNPVGHNLVVHKLPGPVGDKAPRSQTRKATAKRAVKKAGARGRKRAT